MHLVKLNSGDDAEMMLEEILKQGYELASQIIIKTHQRILEKSKQRINPILFFLRLKYRSIYLFFSKTRTNISIID